MSAGKRKIFSYALFLAFITIGGGIALYSQGFRINASDLAIQKIGGIFVRSNPRDAEIALDKKIIKNKSWLLQSGTLINNLVPGYHALVIKKDGYREWQKTIMVEPSLVSEMDSIVLVKEMAPVKIYENVSDFWVEGGNSMRKKEEKVIYNETALPGEKFIVASNDGQFVITHASKTDAYFLYDARNEKPALNLNVLFWNLKKRALNLPGQVPITQIAFNPSSNSQFLVKTKAALYLLDAEQLDIVLLGESPDISLFESKFHALWQTEDGSLWILNPGVTSSKSLVLATGKIKAVRSYAGQNKFNIGLLEESGRLLISDTKNENLRLVATKAVLFGFSPDNQKIAFIDEDGQINIEGLYREKKTGFRLPIGIPIESFLWYKDSEHLLIRFADGSIYLTENDGAKPINTYKLADGADKYFYNEEANLLYFTKGTDVFTFAF